MELEGFLDSSAILRSGVYALVAKGVVLYVGKSRSMIGRINTHRRKWIDKRKGVPGADWIPIPGLLFDEIHVRPCRLDQLDELEREMINLYKPRYNQKLKTDDKIRRPFSLQINGLAIPVNAVVAQAPMERRV